MLAVAAVVYGYVTEFHPALGPEAELRNVREVEPGRFYRSGQLDADTLREVTEAFGIRTVINLRGYDAGKDWHDEETAAARELGIAHHDVHLSARSLPRRDELLRLLDLYRSVEPPILVHCQGGADRAGEATALYAIEQLGETREQALERLTLRQRHLSFHRPAKRAFISAYLGEDWLRESYDPCAPEWGELRREECTAG